MPGFQSFRSAECILAGIELTHVIRKSRLPVDGVGGMPGLSAYVSSKFAVRGMTKVAAIELASLGIRCNSVHPGYSDTPMIRGGNDAADLSHYAAGVPAGRIGTVADVVDVVVFLASDASRYCTGSEIVVDGGLIAGISLPASD